MKKAYITPETLLMRIASEKLIAESIGINEKRATSGGWVKEDNTSSSSSSYNVWNDDWSE